MRKNTFSTIIIGSGIAGLYSALKLAQNNKDKKFLIVTKSKLFFSNSYYAQGGMVAVLNENKNDSVEKHINDTLIAGAGLSDKDTIEYISKNSNKIVNDLLNFGVDFDRSEDGKFTLTKEAAHSVNRILHAGGDATGRKMELALCESIKNYDNVEILEDTLVIDLILNTKNECCGVTTFNLEKEFKNYYANSIIIATGGIGQIYKYTTNPKVATGDGIALAYRAGADLQDLEFVQFHPTALAIDSAQNRFLISEAVRGEGAKLCNRNKEEFMQKYHQLKELAPRDIVARSIYEELEKTNQSNVYLNATIIGEEKLKLRFPTILNVCKKYNVDIINDLIPVAPAAHYYMGGIKTNIYGETSIKNLYAIGEVASTRLHGANRLASNSILECVVLAYTVAEKINNEHNNNTLEEIPNTTQNIKSHKSIDTKEYITQIKEIMWKNVGIKRTAENLVIALNELNKLEENIYFEEFEPSFELYELKNILQVAKLITQSAISRKESRGAHCRLDFPNKSEDEKHSITNISKGEINFVK